MPSDCRLMCSHERRLRATFNLTGHDVGQEPLVTEMAFCARECVRCTVAGPTRAGTVSLYASDLKAEQSRAARPTLERI